MLFMKKTDWNNYYDKPFKVTSITRKITEYFLLKAIQKYSSPALNMRIVELGGANSCFFESIKKKIGFELYCIIDNNRKNSLKEEIGSLKKDFRIKMLG